jgi:Flp pilus assembly protein TadD
MAAAGVIVALSSGCAARGARQRSFAQEFVKPGEPTIDYGTPAAPAAEPLDLHDYMRRVMALQANAKPSAGSAIPTLEGRNPALAAALLRLSMHETAENHRLVAAAYRTAGVSDYAYRHLQRALRLEPCDAAAFEARAQLWRDWGMQDLAVGDAHRAIHCAPASASARNTLGTILQVLGLHDAARAAFEEALRLNARAAFALNNLCYVSLQEGDGAGAQRSCERALELEPRMTTARANLALAYALQGEVGEAEARLVDGADPATGQYNVGILRLSLAQYEGAAEAFTLAAAIKPSLAVAAQRASQARALAAAHREQ